MVTIKDEFFQCDSQSERVCTYVRSVAYSFVRLPFQLFSYQCQMLLRNDSYDVYILLCVMNEYYFCMIKRNAPHVYSEKRRNYTRDISVKL